MRPLRIAVVTGTFPVVSQTFIVNQINALLDSGHEVKLFAYKKGNLHQVHSAINTHDLLNKVTFLKKNNPNHVVRFFEFFFWIIANFRRIKW